MDFFIRSCQQEIKSNIIDDLVFATLNGNHYQNNNQHDLLLKHIEYLSKNPHHVHHSHHDYLHDVHSDEIPHFINPHYHQHRPNSFDYHEYSALSPDYSAAYFDNRFQATPPQIISEPPHREREEKVLEAHEDLMNILSNHKVIQREAPNRRNLTLSQSHFRRIGKRSLLGMLTTIPTVTHPTAPTLPLHPVLLSGEDRWLAGCLMHCIFQKTHSLDRHGIYPTLDGLVDLYTAGTNDQSYFIFTLRAVNKCLKLISFKHHVHRGFLPPRAETCDIAFDVFDCISDSIAYYCNSY